MCYSGYRLPSTIGTTGFLSPLFSEWEAVAHILDQHLLTIIALHTDAFGVSSFGQKLAERDL